MKKYFKSIVLAMVFTLILSSTSTGFMSNAQDGAVVDEEGGIIGYSYGGLYWDVEEYEEIVGSTMARSFAATHEATLTDSSDALTDEDAQLIEEVTCPLGMAIAIGVDEDGNMITYLSGYTFIEEEGVSLGALMNRLEIWNAYKSPYEGVFFSHNWTYKAVKVADGEQMIDVDVEKKTITFSINETVSELEQWDVLMSLRAAVNSEKISK